METPVKKLRNLYGYPQSKMAKILGMDTRAYQNYECKERKLPKSKLDILQRRFGADPESLDPEVSKAPTLWGQKYKKTWANQIKEFAEKGKVYRLSAERVEEVQFASKRKSWIENERKAKIQSLCWEVLELPTENVIRIPV